MIKIPSLTEIKVGKTQKKIFCNRVVANKTTKKEKKPPLPFNKYFCHRKCVKQSLTTLLLPSFFVGARILVKCLFTRME